MSGLRRKPDLSDVTGDYLPIYESHASNNRRDYPGRCTTSPRGTGSCEAWRLGWRLPHVRWGRAVHYAQEPKLFLDFVRTIYVAIGCKVFPSPGAVQALLGHEYEHLASGRGWTSDDMSAATTVHISQRDLDPRTNAIRGLTITARYGDGIETRATILLRPGGLPDRSQILQ
jgi:hypothetical protein